MSDLRDILIRAARMEDVDSILAFSTAMALETEGRRLDHTRLREGTVSLLSAPTHGFFLVAEQREMDHFRLIGQLMVTFEWSDWRNGVFWWVQSVYVSPAWRHRGVFRRMHEEVVARAKADPKVCGIRLYVEQHNHLAQAVYKRVGLTPSTYVVFEQDFVFENRTSVLKHT